MRVIITKDSTSFTKLVNVANSATPLGRVTVPNGVVWDLADGTVFLAKLRDSNNVEIATSSYIAVGVKSPTMVMPKDLGRLEYDCFAALDLAAQSNVQYQDRLRLPIDKGGISLTAGMSIEIWVYSDLVIDWDHSVLSFAVNEYR